jgi:hypothetical protein
VLVLTTLSALIAIIALTVVIAALTAPDQDEDNTPVATPAPIIDDQQAAEMATTVTRSMFEISPATADAQIATFKAHTCGDFAKDALPNLISFTDEIKTQDRSSTVTLQSVAVSPHPPAAPAVDVIVASEWQSGDDINKTRVVYQVIVQNGETCVAKAQFL